MSGTDNANMTVAQKISVLKRGIDKSLMELTEVEVAINARSHSSPVENGGLKRKRLRLMNLIARLDAKLEQLQARSPRHPGMQRCFGPYQLGR